MEIKLGGYLWNYKKGALIYAADYSDYKIPSSHIKKKSPRNSEALKLLGNCLLQLKVDRNRKGYRY